MKVLVLGLVCLIGYSLAQFPSSKFPYRPTQQRPTQPPKPQYYQPQSSAGQHYGEGHGAHIVNDYREVNPDGSFKYEFETSDGTQAEASGYVKGGSGKDDGEQEIKGSFHYIGDDGKTYAIQYIANEEGFQPIGDHIPTPPPIPEYILRSLEYNAKHAQQDESQVYQPQYNKQPKYAASPNNYNRNRYSKK